MPTQGYTRSTEFARGYAAAQDMRAWLGQAGQWVLIDRDAIGEYARPATSTEEAGIRNFYRAYAPGLKVRYSGGEA